MSRSLLAFQPTQTLGLCARSPRRCIASTDASEAIRRALTSATSNQLTVGGVVGFATGYAVKRVGQLLLVFIGCEVVALQLMAQQGWVVVDWPLIGRDLSPHVEKGGVDRIIDAVKLKAPFAGSFTAGCYAGFRWS